MQNEFKGFSEDQQYRLLQKMGYEGPKNQKSINEYLKASPSSAAKLMKYTDQARSYAKGGSVTKRVKPLQGKGGGSTASTAGGKPAVAATNTTTQQNTPKQDTTQTTSNQGPQPLLSNVEGSRTAGQVIRDSESRADRITSNPSQVYENSSSNITGMTAQLDTLNRALAAAQNAETPNNAGIRRLQSEISTLETRINRASTTQALSGQAMQQQALADNRDLVRSSVNDPSSVVTQSNVARGPTGKGYEMGRDDVRGATVSGPNNTYKAATAKLTKAKAPEQGETHTYKADQAYRDVAGITTKNDVGADGDVSREAVIKHEDSSLSDSSFAEGQEYGEAVLAEAGRLGVTPQELVEAQGTGLSAPQIEAATSAGIDPMVAAKGQVQAEELPDAAQIAMDDVAQAEVLSSGGLNDEATATAAALQKFSLSEETLAEFTKGDVTAASTVQGQLSELMQSFDNGTPAWAAGAMRAATAAMNSRGLGGSSMAGAAIVQAAMESALPIAQADAQVYERMNMKNLDNQHMVSLSNAAAQQGVKLANLSNAQQTALQNSQNAASLQAQELSTAQSVVLANAQMKSAIQGQNLSNRQQSNLVTAARYADNANINLNNKQQAALTNNSNKLTTDMSNLSNRQQAYVANAQLDASLQGKVLDNQQQSAILNAARFSEANNMTFSAQEQATLHNSEIMKTIGLAELNSKQAATLQNAVQSATMDLTNASNRQKAQSQNAQAFLNMDLTNLSNEQQSLMFNRQARVNTLLSDSAADNAAMQFNAASQNQADQFFADLQATVSMHNSEQANAIAQFNAGQKNAAAQFNNTMKEQRSQFNASQSLLISQSNAEWRQNVGMAEFEAENLSNREAALAANNLTADSLDQIWQRERDIMAYSFQSGENAADRSLSLLLGDQQLSGIQAQLDAEEDGAIGGIIAWAADNILGGDWDIL